MKKTGALYPKISLDFISFLDVPGIVFSVDGEVLWSASSVGLYIGDTDTSTIFEHALTQAKQGRGRYQLSGPSGDVSAVAFSFQLESDGSESSDAIGVFFQSISRTAVEKSTEALLSAKRLAEEASAAKSLFMANVSHEVRTPLSGIIGFTELLLETDPRDDQKEYLEVLKESAFALMTIVNEILDLSKIEAGKMDIRTERFDIRAVVFSIRDLFSLQTGKKNLQFHVSVDEAVPDMLYGDVDRTGQILKNLISNAIKYTPEGSVDVEITSESLSDRTCLVRFAVRDTGPGIPSDRIADLFTPFSTFESSGNSRREGIGLGLSISKTLAELMGGTISVTSVVGEGSVFVLEAPFSRGVDEAAGGSQGDNEKTSTPLAILFGEDNKANRTFVSHFLRKRGHTVVTAENGLDVINALEQQRFDALILDVQMPFLDGPSTLIQIRRSGKPYSTIPALALTAYAMEGDREQLLKDGMDGYISKPVDLRALETTLVALVHQRTMQSATDIPDSVIDTVALHERYRDDHEVLREILQIFITETPKKLDGLKDPLHSEPKQVLELLHSLVNTSAVVKAGTLYQASQSIEVALRNTGTIECPDLFTELIRSGEAAISAAQRILRTLEAS